HIAFIMDGNGRWARRRGLPRTAGHHEGGKTLLKIVEKCNELGIKAMTVFAFSTENWSRPESEVKYLLELPNKYINNYLPMIKKANIKMNFIGFIDKLPNTMQNNIKLALEETKNNTGMIFTIALNYGAQDEILSATKNIAKDCLSGVISPEDITKEYFTKKLMTYDLPDVDFLIRTSGEIRISNYLLWQIAYSELYFTNKCWPEFTEKELMKALLEYQMRNRKFGGLKGE
ncbi:MAG TPA: isoprenyl transferase, partial [Haloplasmataceae bacterium]